MGGGVAGGLGGALIGSVVPGVGTALGATLGGLAGSGVQNLVGGGGGSTQPAAQPVQTAQGLFQSYTPQAQQQQDYTFQGLQGELGNLSWSGLGALGGQQPAGQLYPQYAQTAGYQAAQTDPAVGGYGYYGGPAIRQALSGMQTLQDLQNTPYNLTNYGQATGAAGLSALPQVQQAAFNPQIGATVQNILNNPYFGQQLAGAQQGAGIGGQAAGATPGQIAQLNQLGGQLPGLGQQAAAASWGLVPSLQGLAGQQAQYGQGLATGAQSLLPGLQQLYGQTVPGLLEAGGQAAAQAGATTPVLQRIGATGEGLAGQAAPLAQQAQSLAPELQDIAARGGGLVNQAPAWAQQAPATSAGLADAQQRILQTGLDPQGALFNQLQQQTRDTANAIAAQSGLAGTPYAAGLANDAQRNLNIQWQNQQLQRQATADQAAAGLASQQLAGVAGGANILNQMTQTGAGIDLNALQQQLAGTTAEANIFGELTQQGANIGMGSAQQQLANVLGGAGAYGDLVARAGQLGGNLAQGQLGVLQGAGGLFNQGAQGASALAGQAGTLANLGLQQQINAAQGAQGLFQGGLGLGQTGAQLAQQAAAYPAQAYQQQQAQGLNALNLQNQIAGGGVANLANLTQQLGAAGQQPITGLTALNQLAAQPYNLTSQQAQNALSAMQNQANFGNQLLQLPQNVLNNAINYLRVGQGAAQTGGLLGQQGFNQNQAQLQGIGALGQGVLGSNLLFGSQGLGGALGVNPQTGLLGGLGGLFGNAATGQLPFGGGFTGMIPGQPFFP